MVALRFLSAEKVIWRKTRKPRSRALVGQTYTIETPLGKAFVTINTIGGKQPLKFSSIRPRPIPKRKAAAAARHENR